MEDDDLVPSQGHYNVIHNTVINVVENVPQAFLTNQQLLSPKELRENSRLIVHKVKMGEKINMAINLPREHAINLGETPFG